MLTFKWPFLLYFVTQSRDVESPTAVSSKPHPVGLGAAKELSWNHFCSTNRGLSRQLLSAEQHANGWIGLMQAVFFEGPNPPFSASIYVVGGLALAEWRPFG